MAFVAAQHRGRLSVVHMQLHREFIVDVGGFLATPGFIATRIENGSTQQRTITTRGEITDSSENNKHLVTNTPTFNTSTQHK
jgi:hypothetical protein